jgi:hypothetical protein
MHSRLIHDPLDMPRKRLLMAAMKYACMPNSFAMFALLVSTIHTHRLKSASIFWHSGHQTARDLSYMTMLTILNSTYVHLFLKVITA